MLLTQPLMFNDFMRSKPKPKKRLHYSVIVWMYLLNGAVFHSEMIMSLVSNEIDKWL